MSTHLREIGPVRALKMSKEGEVARAPKRAWMTTDSMLCTLATRASVRHHGRHQTEVRQGSVWARRARHTRADCGVESKSGVRCRLEGHGIKFVRGVRSLISRRFGDPDVAIHVRRPCGPASSARAIRANPT